MLVSMGGFIDAGRTQRLLTEHLLAAHDHTVVASFDLDQLLDYRGRRPMMTFDRDRFTSYEDPSLLLYRLTDRDGHPFLLLAGAEPDYQWERVVEAVMELEQGPRASTSRSASTASPWPCRTPVRSGSRRTPPTRDSSPQHQPVFGTVQVPASWSALLELRLGESGHDALGFAVHVPHYLAQAEFADAALAGLGAVSGVTGLSLSMTDLAAAAGLNRAEIAREVDGSDEVKAVVEALERQYDTFMEGRERPSLLATGVSELPSADEIGAEFEAFLKDVVEDDKGKDENSGGFGSA